MARDNSEIAQTADPTRPTQRSLTASVTLPFLSLPIVSFNFRPQGHSLTSHLQGHHEHLQKTLSSFTNGLLETRPVLPGLDHTIVIPPRRLHLTLGVMSLDPEDAQSVNSNKTLSEALSLLSSLRPQILELLCGARLNVPLQIMNIMPPEDDDLDKAHVLWCGPSPDNEDAQRLRARVSSETDVPSRFVLDKICPHAWNENAVLQLHCTVLNTTYRRPRARGRREPFSYRSILASPVAQALLSEPQGDANVRHPVKIDFGTWHVNDIQICKMGSHGPEGEYESCGGIALN
ncbi:kinase A anchor protein [Chiua virens]|nr:kinase A anchor protein [Chiua virens]